MSNHEQEYVWLLEDSNTCTVFVGYDHLRRSSKSYTSWNHSKIRDLANKIASQRNIEIIENFNLNVTIH